MRSITMADVAKKAGVSRKYVSGILNNSKSIWVSRETRDRVKNIARKLNYQPNHIARSLKTGKTYKIGIMGNSSRADIRAYFFAKTIEGVERALSEADSKYSLMIFGANFNSRPEKSYELIEQRVVDGLIFPVASPDLKKFAQQFVPRLQQLDIPFVVVHATAQDLPYNNVGLDNAYAGFCAAEHFIKMGYQDIRFFLRDRGNPQLMETLAGFQQGFAHFGRTWNKASILVSPYRNPLDSLHATREILQGLVRLPEAIFFPEDGSAYMALNECRKQGVRVPQDLAVMGFDDEEPAPYFQTNLTTIHHPFMEKGKAAVTMLEEILEGWRDRTAVHRQILKPHLVVRETCGAKKSTDNEPRTTN